MLTILLLASAAALLPRYAAESQPISPAPALTFSDLADLALPATVVAHVRIDDADRLNPKESPGVPAGHRRFFVSAEVVSLIRGPSGFPAVVEYLVDVPNGANGRAPRLRRKSEHLILARTLTGRPGALSLVARDAQIPFDAANADRLRTIVRQSIAKDAPPAIRGIGRAFHVPGTLPGESDTRIFLLTADGRPVSLEVSRRPGAPPRVSVSLSDIVEDASPAPQRDTLLWYRLACTLPSALPTRSLNEVPEEAAGAVRADYRLLLETLGSCRRNRAPQNEASSTPTPAQSG